MATKRKKVVQGHGYGMLNAAESGMPENTLPTSQTGITRMTGRGPAAAAPGSLPTGQTSITRGNGGVGAANLGTMGPRTVVSSGNSIGSGTVRGEMPATTAPTATSPVKSTALRMGQSTPANRQAAGAMMRQADHTNELGGGLKTNHGMGRSNCKF